MHRITIRVECLMQVLRKIPNTIIRGGFSTSAIMSQHQNTEKNNFRASCGAASVIAALGRQR